MHIAATVMNRIRSATITSDGKHLALTGTGNGSEEFTVGITLSELPRLLELAAQAVTGEASRTQQQLRFPVLWWNLERDTRAGTFALVLTLAPGALVTFDFSDAMIAALRETLERHGSQLAGERPGFT